MMHFPCGYSFAAPGFSTTVPAFPLNAAVTETSDSAKARSNALAFSQEFTASTIHSRSPWTRLPPSSSTSSCNVIGSLHGKRNYRRLPTPSPFGYLTTPAQGAGRHSHWFRAPRRLRSTKVSEKPCHFDLTLSLP